MHLNGYKTLLTVQMFDAWEMARSHFKRAQTKQKQQQQHYGRGRPACFEIGNIVYMPVAKSRLGHKLVRPYCPYHITTIEQNVVEVIPIDQPRALALHGYR